MQTWAGARLNRLLEFWRSRLRRRWFWGSIVCLLLGYVVMSLLVPEPLLGLISLPFWLLIAGRRLHDMNARGFWALIPAGSGFVIGFANGFTRSATGSPIIDTAQLNVVVGLASIGFIILLGAWPGSKAANRYGPRPGAVTVTPVDKPSTA
ncbi:DUF805 domain-containing protein [Brevundimonas sp.]|uniref:DUF805 domain-containing protein n=1 Tax=Brevundimonas sp. TaxID=1871086 RepID=UPI00344D2DDF